MLESYLDNLGIKELNQMQLDALDADPRRDLVLLAPTGSGKTLAYLLPIIQRILQKSSLGEPAGVKAIIIVPSRELALQIEQVFKSLKTSIKINAVYGGHTMRTEKNNFTHAPAVLTGTPGRLAWHVNNRSFDLETVDTLILDEFDKSLEFGFQNDMEFIIAGLPSLQRRVLTSATKMAQIPIFTGIREPLILDHLSTAAILPDLEVKAVIAKPEDKLDVLFDLICHIGERATLVFCNHREAVDRISQLLTAREVIHTVFHGGMEQEDREKALLKFRNGSTRLLISTDLASRGLDIPEIECIIHYQSSSREAFIHRNGRTARMHASGAAYVLLAPEERLSFLPPDLDELIPGRDNGLPPLTPWATLFFKAGKKEKVSKMDIVGLLLKKGGLEAGEVGLIEIQDHTSYAAISRAKLEETLDHIKHEKLKNQKIKMGVSP